MIEILRCPVCKQTFTKTPKGVTCPKNHSFDRSKEGYINFLTGGYKSGTAMGDNRSMAQSRKAFLDKGFFNPLADGLAALLSAFPENSNVLDICCGEGFYTHRLKTLLPTRMYYGFDLSKAMIRHAAKRKCGSFFVANISNIPVSDESVDFAFHLFAPFHQAEFYRILKKDGMLVTVIPGKRHLYGLKEIVYDKPYENDEKEPNTGNFIITDRIRISKRITLQSNEDITSVFQMTPYYYHTPASGIQNISALTKLTTEIEFLLICCKK